MVSHANWPADFVDLKKLEDILQCSICYEYINTCMITPCSHNFCSLCIRKYLQFKTQCPTCFEETHGSDLRKNRLVDDVISIWLKLKDLLLFDVRLAAMTKSIKSEPKLSNGVDSPSKVTEGKSLKKESMTPKVEKGKKAVVQKLFSEKKPSPEGNDARGIVIDGVVIPSIFQPSKSPKKNLGKKQEDMSLCPVCNVEVPLRNLNMHLDSCLAASDPAPSRLKPKAEKRDPIPKRVYSLMKEKDLKKCLKDFGLGTGGDRQAMIKRISRYIVLYNAECDKEEPRPVSEILKQVEREERDEKATSANPLFQAVRPPNLPHDKKKDPEAIEKANKDYLDLNRDNFKKLIENMRARDGKNIKPLKPLNRIESDDEGEALGDADDGGGYDAGPSTSGLPSGGRAKPGVETISIYSQETVVDSEEDIFERSPVKAERPSTADDDVRQIDWGRTHVNDESALDTQAMEMEVKEEEATEEEKATDINKEDSEEYESVFDSSMKQAPAAGVAAEPPRTPRSRLSLSARKKRPSSPVGAELSAHLFKSNPDTQTGEDIEPVTPTSRNKKLTNGNTHEDSEDSEETDSDDDSEEDDVEESFSPLKTPTKNRDLSPEISPMKTRSAVKRKSQTSGEKTPSRAGRRKRVKPSVSPTV